MTFSFIFQSGKTTIANFLSDATENSSGEYRPTQGVRILEFEMQNLNVNNRYLKAEVELWDCSGDHKYVFAVLYVLN
jgi:Rab-like protein 5